MASEPTGGKRPLDAGAYPDSKASRTESPFASLPLELMANIIKYVTDAELDAMEQVDMRCRKLALKERVVRVFEAFPRELGQFAARKYGLPADALTVAGGAFAVEIVAARCLPIKQNLIERLTSGDIEFQDVVQSKEQLKEGLLNEALDQAHVAQALILKIESSDSPVETRGRAVRTAAENGHINIVRQLLANGAVISDLHRGFAVVEALRRRSEDIVRDLLANGPIAADVTSEVVGEAAENGYSDIVQQFLVENADLRGVAVGGAVRGGHREIVQALLAGGAIIGEEDMEQAVEDAVTGDRLDILQVLLENNENLRGWAVTCAVIQNNFEMIQALLAEGEILEEDRRQAIQHAVAENRSGILRVLLVGHEDLRGLAVIHAATGGHLDLTRELLAAGVISQEDRVEAFRGAVLGNHSLSILALMEGQGALSLRGRMVIGASERGNLSRVNLFLTKGTISEADRTRAIEVASGPDQEAIRSILQSLSGGSMR